MIVCPTREKLGDFLAGTCGEAESTRIENHIAECSSCCEYCLSAGSDQELLSEIRSAMGFEGKAASPDAQTMIDATLTSRDASKHDDRLGVDPVEGYRIIRELGRGGMGVVYLAHQDSTKRDVALKVLLDGPLASTTAKRRFEREVELAARFSHPHIVTVLDSGLARGRHYVAMQYVQGERLDRYAKSRRMSVRDLLALFAKVCRAVGYAHRRGVMHRDLKPSNILVDAAGEPHVLDFGLAKQENEVVPYTVSVPGQLVGTVPYMSPEQACGDSADMDVRSDVYSLGVILYRLLAGRFPYDISKDVRETLDRIATAAPIRPRRIRGDLDRDVETIVLRALAKERERRYQSAAEFAEDIERYLSRRPIEARRDEALYVFNKFLRRHRFAVGTAMMFVVLVAAATTATLRRRAADLQQEVAAILVELVDNFPKAAARIAGASERTHEALRETLHHYVSSPAYTERIAGTRGAILASADAFWESVDRGMLGMHGEWLELAELPPDEAAKLIPRLVEKTRGATDREKYVAFCLIGQFARPDAQVAKACVEAARTESNPGVAAAARWAAGRLGQNVAAAQTEETFPDPVSSLTFVRIGEHDGRRGGPVAFDPDRFPDEGLPDEPVDIRSFYLAATEVTWQVFAPFLDDPAVAAVYPRRNRDWMESAIAILPTESRPDAAVGYVTLEAARTYCRWLSDRGRDASPPRRYRLPTEDEWEHASRGGGAGRFCYGDNVKYARYFAHCDGADSTWPIAALRMPNAYGLFDTHGLWEWTDTRYPSELLNDPAMKTQELWVYRGGAYHSPAVRCRCAQRNYGSGAATDYNGFRIVMELETQ